MGNSQQAIRPSSEEIDISRYFDSHSYLTACNDQAAIRNHELYAIIIIPFHRFISDKEAHADDTKIKQEDRKSVQRKTIKTQKKHTVKQDRKWTYMHIYTTRSDFTKALGLLLAVQRVASNFLALLGRVSLVRGVAEYSHQTFTWTICRSVRRSVLNFIRIGLVL